MVSSKLSYTIQKSISYNLALKTALWTLFKGIKLQWMDKQICLHLFFYVQNSDVYKHKYNPAISCTQLDCSHQKGSQGQAAMLCRLIKCVSASLNLKYWVRRVWLCLDFGEDEFSGCGAVQDRNNVDKWRNTPRRGKFMLDTFLCGS